MLFRQRREATETRTQPNHDVSSRQQISIIEPTYRQLSYLQSHTTQKSDDIYSYADEAGGRGEAPPSGNVASMEEQVPPCDNVAGQANYINVHDSYIEPTARQSVTSDGIYTYINEDGMQQQVTSGGNMAQEQLPSSGNEAGIPEEARSSGDERDSQTREAEYDVPYMNETQTRYKRV